LVLDHEFFLLSFPIFFFLGSLIFLKLKLLLLLTVFLQQGWLLLLLLLLDMPGLWHWLFWLVSCLLSRVLLAVVTAECDRHLLLLSFLVSLGLAGDDLV